MKMRYRKPAYRPGAWQVRVFEVDVHRLNDTHLGLARTVLGPEQLPVQARAARAMAKAILFPYLYGGDIPRRPA